jgi:hypothetical protein
VAEAPGEPAKPGAKARHDQGGFPSEERSARICDFPPGHPAGDRAAAIPRRLVNPSLTISRQDVAMGGIRGWQHAESADAHTAQARRPGSSLSGPAARGVHDRGCRAGVDHLHPRSNERQPHAHSRLAGHLGSHPAEPDTRVWINGRARAFANHEAARRRSPGGRGERESAPDIIIHRVRRDVPFNSGPALAHSNLTQRNSAPQSVPLLPAPVRRGGPALGPAFAASHRMNARNTGATRRRGIQLSPLCPQPEHSPLSMAERPTPGPGSLMGMKA